MLRKNAHKRISLNAGTIALKSFQTEQNKYQKVYKYQV